MKLLIAIFVCVCVSTVLTRSVDEGLDEKLVNKGWEKLLIKIANVDPNDLVLKNHLIQYLENYEKTKANEAKGTSMYLGCFKDHRRTRMFRGFAEISNKQMTPQACIDTCHYRRYAYAGAQSGYLLSIFSDLKKKKCFKKIFKILEINVTVETQDQEPVQMQRLMTVIVKTIVLETNPRNVVAVG